MRNFKTLPSRELNGGIQYWAWFSNGYGASIVQHKFSYGGDQGLWELAVMITREDFSGEICYDTPITSDVIGRMDDAEVNETLEAIRRLPAYVAEADDVQLPQDTYDGGQSNEQ